MRCSLVLLLAIASLGQSALAQENAAPAPPAAPPADEVTIVLVGDVGLNRGRKPVHPDGIIEGTDESSLLPWAKTSAGIAGLVDGHINFMNLETVVTDRNDLVADSKGQKNPYSFRSHPSGVRHLVDIGFNLVSLANNHSYDYGEDGVRETLRHMNQLLNATRPEGAGAAGDAGADKPGEPGKSAAQAPARPLLGYAGLGENRSDAARTVSVSVATGGRKSFDIGFAALGIVTNNLKRHRADNDKPGSVAYRFDDDWKLVVDTLGNTKADYRILSVHYGYERQVRTDARQRGEWRWAVRDRGVDLVVGHHAHVARGVEMDEKSGGLIFYGLGNFLHRGTRNMGAAKELRLCRDFGVLARVHLRRGDDGHLTPRAVEVVPITGMHRTPHPFRDPAAGRRRVEVLNYHAEALDGGRSRGLRFTPQKDGTGLFCVPGAEKDGGRVGTLCTGYRKPADLGPKQRKKIVRACRRLRH